MSVICFGPEKFQNIGATLLAQSRKSNREHMLCCFMPTQMKWSQRYEIVRDPESFREFVEVFVSDLHKANVATWNDTYGETDEPQPIELNKGKPYLELCALAKSLSSVHYNLISNDGTEHTYRNAYERLEALLHAVHAEIVHNLPAYDNANVWSE